MKKKKKRGKRAARKCEGRLEEKERERQKGVEEEDDGGT